MGEPFDFDVEVTDVDDRPSNPRHERLYGILQALGVVMMRDFLQFVLDAIKRHGHGP